MVVYKDFNEMFAHLRGKVEEIKPKEYVPKEEKPKKKATKKAKKKEN